MADTVTSAPGHAEAVKAVTGQKDPEEIATTADLKSEKDLHAKLDKESAKAASPFTASLDGDERDQRFVRTLENGKTEALLVEPEPFPRFPPDDGGYNPEKRTHAGPAGTKVPSAVGKATMAQSDAPVGWEREAAKEK